MELFVAFKRETASDPFGDADPTGQFQKLLDTACTTRDQMTQYSTRMQMYQFRTCAFSVGIFGKVARLFRWDRAGVLVSAPIKYSAAGNRELSEFFYRVNLMNRSQRGWDPTVCDATQEETAAFTQAIQIVVGEENTVLLKSLLESVGEPSDYPRKKISVIYGTGKRASYIVGRPSVNAELPTGRSTRGFVAMDTDTKKLVFLKDSWRPSIDGLKSEGHWYKKMKGGTNIAAFSHGSNVGRVKKGGKDRTQRTITQNYSKRCSSVQRMMNHVHYRTVQSEFYIPLEMFRDSKSLTQIMYDIVLGKCLLSTVQRFAAHPVFSDTVPLQQGDLSSRYQHCEHHDDFRRSWPAH